ncbi:MAG: purine-nucleoside phosphorylase [Candidatus Sumerlaeaceae bacterium]
MTAPPANALRHKINEAAEFIRGKTSIAPQIGIILGTGMGALSKEVKDATVIDYREIPHFPVSTVESHAGRLHLGQFGGKPVFMMQGRFHFYEGYSLQQVTFPVRVMRALGCDVLIVMNAVGSMNLLIPPGALVIARDHINLMGDNPLIGPNDEELGPRFPDMSEPYSRDLIVLAEAVALERRIANVHRGVMVAVTGPNLETAAEYRMFQRMGADIVTMSTVPEVIVAVHGGMRVLGVSTVTDACLPDALHAATLEQIIKVAGEAEPRLTQLITGVVEKI